MKLWLTITFVLFASTKAQANAEEEACEVSAPEIDRALIQVRKANSTKTKTCSYQLQGDQDGSQVCVHLQKLASYTSGASATLDQEGYEQTAELCCHHEMSLFVRREIERQGFDVCDLSDLHGFVHWYDCSNDMPKTFAEMQAEIAGVMTGNCPWLGHLPNCPVKGENCYEFPSCQPESFPADSQAGSSALLDEAGYQAVAKRCCHTEMEQFVRRQIDAMGFQICEPAALQGYLHWFDCSSQTDKGDDHQTLEKLKEGLVMGRSGLPPLCPWLGGVGEACPPTGHNCPVVEVPEPDAHRRRTACR